MNKILLYTILVFAYIVLVYIQVAIYIFLQHEISGRWTGGIVAFGGIFSFWTSYKICKWLKKKLTSKKETLETKASKEKITKPKPKPKPKPDDMPKNKTLYTFFFGYSSFKWRRLIRTLLLIPAIVWQVFVFFVAINDMFINPEQRYEDIFWFLYVFSILGYFILIGLISWLVKPFVVEEG